MKLGRTDQRTAERDVCNNFQNAPYLHVESLGCQGRERILVRNCLPNGSMIMKMLILGKAG